MKFPIGIQNFEKLREEGFVYVDKTELMYNLISVSGYYFLSRPRRFGKSLLVSMMDAYFSGKKDLFKGLAVEKLETEWKKYPVLRFDFTGAAYTSVEDLNAKLDAMLSEIEGKYGVDKRYENPSIRFGNLIANLTSTTGERVVVLIDEYDKPVVDNLDNADLREKMKTILKGFYGVMKGRDEYIRFGFMTGVSKLGKMSIFSDLNNVTDISMDPDYVDICGISETDLHGYFDEEVHALASANEISTEDCYSQLANLYDGYHFEEGTVGVYNPFSLLNTLRSKRFREYWFETGTPTFLIKALKLKDYNISSVLNSEIKVSTDNLTQVDYTLSDPIPLLYQSGYLTIKGYNSLSKLYTLGFPNEEVANGFMKLQLPFYAPVSSNETGILIATLFEAIHEGNPDLFMQKLQTMFASTSYQIQGDAEKDFQYAMQLIFRLLTSYVEVEYPTSDGRMDVFVKTQKYIYIFELKINSSAAEAMNQIEEKQYALRFADESRRIYKIGANFDTDTRRLTDYLIR